MMSYQRAHTVAIGIALIITLIGIQMLRGVIIKTVESMKVHRVAYETLQHVSQR